MSLQPNPNVKTLNVLKPISLNTQKDLNSKKNDNINEPDIEKDDGATLISPEILKNIKAKNLKAKFLRAALRSGSYHTKPTLVSVSTLEKVEHFDAQLATDRALSALNSQEQRKSKKTFPLYVGDLGENITEDCLKKKFSEIGPISSVRICNSNSGGSLRYGYVNFENQKDADRALDELNYTRLLDSEIRIMHSFRNQQNKNNSLGTNVFFSNLPDNLSTREFYEMFKNKGDILSCKLNKEKNIGFVMFKSRRVAVTVVDEYNGAKLKDKEIFVTIHTSKDVRHKPKEVTESGMVFVKNLSIDVSEIALRKKFEPFGTVISIYIKPVTKLDSCWSLITFEKKSCAETAVKALNKTILDKKEISCSMAKSNFNQENTLVIFENLPESFDKNQLKTLCLAYGNVLSVKMEKVTDAVFFLIEMENPDIAFLAVKNLRKQKLNNKYIDITYCSEQHFRNEIDSYSDKTIPNDNEITEKIDSFSASESLNDENEIHQQKKATNNLIPSLKKDHVFFPMKPSFKNNPFKYNSLTPLNYDVLPNNNHKFATPLYSPSVYTSTSNNNNLETVNKVKFIVSHFINEKKESKQVLPITNIGIIANHIINVYWENDFDNLERFLLTYDIHKERNNLFKIHVETTLKYFS